MIGILTRAAAWYRVVRGRRTSQFTLPRSRDGVGADLVALEQEFSRRESTYRASILEANLILTVSHFAKRTYVLHGYPADRIDVMPIASRSMDYIQWRQRKFQAYPVRFGFLGNVGPFKGAHVLAEAVRTFDPARAVFHFYGPIRPEDRHYLRHLAGPKTAMAFHGPFAQEDLPHILDELDVLVLPSIQQETLGLAGLEAQAAGLPIIGAAIGAIPEYVQHEQNGLLFKVGSPAALQMQIQHILDHPHLINEFSSLVQPPKRLANHVVDLMSAYARLQHRVVA